MPHRNQVGMAGWASLILLRSSTRSRSQIHFLLGCEDQTWCAAPDCGSPGCDALPSPLQKHKRQRCVTLFLPGAMQMPMLHAGWCVDKGRRSLAFKKLTCEASLSFRRTHEHSGAPTAHWQLRDRFVACSQDAKGRRWHAQGLCGGAVERRAETAVYL